MPTDHIRISMAATEVSQLLELHLITTFFKRLKFPYWQLELSISP